MSDNRRNILVKDLSSFFSQYRKGSPITRSVKQSTLLSIINDFKKINSTPASWKSLSSDTILALVSLWKIKKITDGTICQKLSIIRWFNTEYNLKITIPNNSALCLKRNAGKNLFIDFDHHQLLSNNISPINRYFYYLQIKLGLTKSEAIKINVSQSIKNGKLFIDKKISFNSRSREVLLYDDIITPDLILTKSIDLESLSFFHDAELKLLKINKRTILRYIYFLNRFQQLSSNINLTRKKAIAIIGEETGLQDFKLINNVLLKNNI